MSKRTEAVPADEVGAELAVTQPAFPELADLIDGTMIPLDVARGMDDQRLEAVAVEVVRMGRITEAMRLAVGAALHGRRNDYEHGKWLTFVQHLAVRCGVKTAQLGRWMTEAERHYGLELPKGANPTRRGPKPKLAAPASLAVPAEATPDSDPVSPADAADVFGPAPSNPSEPLRKDAPPPATTTPDPWDDGLAPPRKTPLAPGPGVAEVEKVHGDPLGRALDVVLLANPNELAVWVQANLTKATAAHGALDRALTDLSGRKKTPEGQWRQRGAKPGVHAASDQAAKSGCAHPRAKREPVGGYAVRCKDCSTTKATGALLDADGAA